MTKVGTVGLRPTFGSTDEARVPCVHPKVGQEADGTAQLCTIGLLVCRGGRQPAYNEADGRPGGLRH
jgi:hypothetical protein